MFEERTFQGGMDSDSEDRFIQTGDYRLGFCIRNSKKSDGTYGTVTNCLGTELVSFTLPGGENTVIGSLDDLISGNVYYWVHNNASEHGIYEYNIAGNQISTVVQGSFLNFNRDKKIISPQIQDGILYYTDNNVHPRKVNVSRGKTGGYPLTITDVHINNIVPQSVIPPDVGYVTDVTKSVNNLRKKMWQFTLQYVDWDNAQSAWGTFSKVLFSPIEIIKEATYADYNVFENNAIDITIDTGPENVRKIRIAVRDSNITNILLVDTIDKDELGLSDNSSYTYRFFNDRTHIPIDVVEASQLQDFVPLLSQENTILADSRRLGYFNITEGFDNITNTDVDTAVLIDEAPTTDDLANNLITPATNVTNNSILLTNADGDLSNLTFTSTLGLAHSFSTDLLDPGTIVVLKAEVKTLFKRLISGSGQPVSVDSGSFSDSFIYTVQQGDSLTDVINEFINFLSGSTDLNKPYISASSPELQTIPTNTPSPSFMTAVNNAIWTFSSNFGTLPPGDTVRLESLFRMIWDVFPPNSSPRLTFKRGSSHPVALVYYDDPGRRSTVQEIEEVYVPFSTENQLFGPASIELKINHIPPDWAYYYQVVYAGNSQTTSFLQFRVFSNETVDTDKNTRSFIINLTQYDNEYENNSILSYSFTKGDRARLIKKQNTINSNLYAEYNDLEVVSFDSGTQTLVIRADDLPPVQSLDLIEIYTPKLTNEERLYYEIGEAYEIGNPTTGTRFHKGKTQDQTTSLPAIVTLERGDVYWKPRYFNFSFNQFSVAGRYLIEEFNFSDFYDSNSWDKGKPNKIDDNAKRIIRKSTAYYSEPFIPETLVNGLSTFYETSFKYYDDQYGSIQKVDIENDRALVFQETKVGFILINESRLYDDSGSVVGTVQQLTEVLSDMNYFNKEYGIGTNPESFARYGAARYFVDANRGAVLKLGGSGVERISSSEDAQVDYIRMHTYFTNAFKRRKESARPFFIYGEYHQTLGEYVLSFDDVRAVDQISIDKTGKTVVTPGAVIVPGETIAWSEDKGRWVTEYPFIPDYLSSAGTGLVSWDNGDLYVHNKGAINTFYGTYFDSYMDVVFNDQANFNKFYKHVVEKSTTTWRCVQITNAYGQSSNLVDEDFEELEDIFKAAFLQDENTPNVTNPLIEGDDLRCHSLRVRFQNSSTKQEIVLSFGAGFEISALNN